ncbi:MAG: 50S ribosomal protein L9 [bacterium]|nr:50S ribosomal protein L9 [bacterium]
MATLEIILTEDIGKLGTAGDVVRVRAGYGRNYLIPQGMALLATAGRVNEMEHKRRVIEERNSKAVSGLQDIARRATAVELSFEVQASSEGKLFGSVTNSDIAARLAENGVEVDRRKIATDPIKQVGQHEVPLRLHREVIVALKVAVVSGEVVDEEPVEEEEGYSTAGMDDGSREAAREIPESD